MRIALREVGLINHLIKGTDIDLQRIDEGRVTKRFLQWKPVGRKRKGRPQILWVEDRREHSNNKQKHTQGYDALEKL